MVLIVIPILIGVLFAIGYGVKSNSKAIRIFSYFGIFLIAALTALLVFALIIERIED